MTLVFKDVCRNFHFFLCLVLFLPQHTAQSKNMVNMLSYQGWNFNVSLRKLKVSPWKLQHFISYTRWQIACQLFERKNCHIFLPQYCGPSMMWVIDGYQLRRVFGKKDNQIRTGNAKPDLICTWFMKNQFGKIKFDELDF